MTKHILTFALLSGLVLNSCKDAPSQDSLESTTTETVETVADDIVATTSTDKDGNKLDMTFNNTAGTVKVYLNGGEQIDLVAEKAASGIWYKNDQYELRGKGENVVLTKDGETVFKN